MASCYIERNLFHFGLMTTVVSILTTLCLPIGLFPLSERPTLILMPPQQECTLKLRTWYQEHPLPKAASEIPDSDECSVRRSLGTR